MKKIMLIDGGPRKNMNTAAMLDSFAKGAQSISPDIEVKHIHLYHYQYHGCYSCMGCKLKDKPVDHCIINDGITPVLKEATYADGICFGSPVYYMDVTGQMRCFIERLIFPWLDYKTHTTHPPKRIPTAFIYTMNATEQYMPMIEAMCQTTEMGIELSLTKPQRILMLNTSQVKDYSRYEFTEQTALEKAHYKAVHYEDDLQKAYQAGQSMARAILTQS